MKAPRFVALLVAALVAACAPPAPPTLPTGSYPGSDGRAHRLDAMRAGASALVVTFFSRRCPCQAAHDARLRALAEAYAPRGVRFVAVDADADATPAIDAAEASARGYAYPILSDPRAAVADALGAEVATDTLVFDAAGRPRYHGGIDSDWMHPTDHAEPWLRDALDAVLRGEPPRPAARRALGCAIRKR